MSNLTSLQTAIDSLPEIQIVERPEETAPVCESCGGTGYIRFDVPFGHPYFGHMVECDAPGCPVVEEHRRQRVQKIMQQSTWDADYSRFTFQSFSELLGADSWDGKRGAFAVASVFATWDGQPFTLDEAALQVWNQHWPKNKDGKVDNRPSNCAVFTGPVGVGKTSLLAASTNLLLERNKPVVFIRIRDLISRIQETYKIDWEGEPKDARFRFYNTLPFLILDEFALENYTDDRLEIVETVIRARDRAALPTLYSTNMNLSDMYAKWQPRIADIVAKSHWVEVGGTKLRQTREKAQSW